MLDLVPEGGVWVDLGCGTGSNAEFMSELGKLKSFKKVYLVDLSTSLLAVARKRIKENGWTNVEVRRKSRNFSSILSCTYSDDFIGC